MYYSKASLYPLPFAHKACLQEAGRQFYIHATLSCPQGLGTRAHSRKHILVSPGGPGVRKGSERAEQQGEKGAEVQRRPWSTRKIQIPTAACRVLAPSPATHTPFLAQSPQAGELQCSYTSHSLEAAGFSSSLSPCLLWPLGLYVWVGVDLE